MCEKNNNFHFFSSYLFISLVFMLACAGIAILFYNELDNPELSIVPVVAVVCLGKTMRNAERNVKLILNTIFFLDFA